MTIHVIGATGGLIGTFVAHLLFLIGLGSRVQLFVFRLLVVILMAIVLIFYVIITIHPFGNHDLKHSLNPLCEWSATALIAANVSFYYIDLKNITVIFQNNQKRSNDSLIQDR